MAQREKGGRVVFIGNIPYGVSEEQIMDIFGRAGQVVNFRLVYDKETGQPKGFGFLEYTDVDAAASAVRNLNDFDLNGRTLRVDYSNDNRGANQNQAQDTNRPQPPPQFGIPPQQNGRPDVGTLPPLPQGLELPPGVTAFDAISRTINNVPTPQLVDFISQIKGLCATNPAQASALLTQAPQLAYAVFQAMLLLDLVDANIVAQLVATVPPAAHAPAPAPAPPSMPPQVYTPQQLPPPPQQGYSSMPQGYPPGYGQPPQPQYVPTPPQGQAYQPPPQAAPPQPDPSQKALIDQVMALTPEQIYALPEAAREQIKELRRQYGAPV